jgi:hypothetical protein
MDWWRWEYLWGVAVVGNYLIWGGVAVYLSLKKGKDDE